MRLYYQRRSAALRNELFVRSPPRRRPSDCRVRHVSHESEIPSVHEVGEGDVFLVPPSVIRSEGVYELHPIHELQKQRLACKAEVRWETDGRVALHWVDHTPRQCSSSQPEGDWQLECVLLTGNRLGPPGMNACIVRDSVNADGQFSLFQRLPNHQRGVVERYVLERQPFQEIALALGISVPTVRALLRHGLENLRRQIERSP